jgi:hypothetical protein
MDSGDDGTDETSPLCLLLHSFGFATDLHQPVHRAFGKQRLPVLTFMWTEQLDGLKIHGSKLEGISEQLNGDVEGVQNFF